MRSEEYKAGVALRAKPELLDGMDDKGRDEYGYCLVIDFLHSLTPAQVDRFRHHDELPYEELSRQQQDVLLEIARSRWPDRKLDDLQGSILTLLRIRDRFALSWGKATSPFRGRVMFILTAPVTGGQPRFAGSYVPPAGKR